MEKNRADIMLEFANCKDRCLREPTTSDLKSLRRALLIAIADGKDTVLYLAQLTQFYRGFSGDYVEPAGSDWVALTRGVKEYRRTTVPEGRRLQEQNL